jgi:hypothetical protein
MVKVKLRLIPIFDTNVFADVQRAQISQTDWNFLLRHRPHHGWPMSQVTALELLAGVHFVQSDKFSNIRKQIVLAYDLSKGRVLNDPRFLLGQEILRIPFPPEELPPAASMISKYMDVLRRTETINELLTSGIPYKGKCARLESTSILADLMAGPKKNWVDALEKMADGYYPAWRELFKKTGLRLPLEMRRELEPKLAWKEQRYAFVRALLEWLHAPTNQELVTEISIRLDAVLEFAIFVAREFLLRNYSSEKHQSDVFDQFQLQYLAFDRFNIVTRDSDLLTRTQNSPQAARIISFENFLSTL